MFQGLARRITETSEDRSVATWQVIEPVAVGLGGAGGEVLGGMWVLLVSLLSLRAHMLPTCG